MIPVHARETWYGYDSESYATMHAWAVEEVLLLRLEARHDDMIGAKPHKEIVDAKELFRIHDIFSQNNCT